MSSNLLDMIVTMHSVLLVSAVVNAQGRGSGDNLSISVDCIALSVS